MKGLYFIAIVPPREIAERIHEIRKDFAKKYQSEAALKPPVHLTLKEPFLMEPKDELILKRKLNFIASQTQPFHHVLKNFDRFQEHTIFIKAELHPFLKQLKTHIKKLFKTTFYYLQQDQMPFNPHYTIAYRDIPTGQFQKAFSAFEHKTFFAEFTCNQFVLMKHDGMKWQNLEKYRLTAMPQVTLFDNLEDEYYQKPKTPVLIDLK